VLNLAVAGLAAGGSYALIGVSLVLLYRVGAVVNFSQTFAATFAVFAMTDLLDKDWNLWTAVAAAMAIGIAIAAAQGFIMARLFRNSDVLIRSTVAMAMAIALFGLTVRVFHDKQRFFPALFSSLSRRIGDVLVSGQVVVALFGAVVLSVILWLILSYTRLGTILRAVAGRPVTAELMGVRTTRLVVLVWAVAGALTTAAIILVAPTRGSIPNMVVLVIPALAAAVVGAMRSFALTVVGGLALGMIESMALDWGFIGNYRPSLSFAVIAVVLLWSQRKETWSEAR